MTYYIFSIHRNVWMSGNQLWKLHAQIYPCCQSPWHGSMLLEHFVSYAGLLQSFIHRLTYHQLTFPLSHLMLFLHQIVCRSTLWDRTHTISKGMCITDSMKCTLVFINMLLQYFWCAFLWIQCLIYVVCLCISMQIHVRMCICVHM